MQLSQTPSSAVAAATDAYARNAISQSFRENRKLMKLKDTAINLTRRLFHTICANLFSHIENAAVAVRRHVDAVFRVRL